MVGTAAASAAGDGTLFCFVFLLLAPWGASSATGTVNPCQQRPTPLAGLKYSTTLKTKKFSLPWKGK
jgi:hypothetical protein